MIKNNKSLQIYKENFFTKIKKFFKNLFNSRKLEKNQEEIKVRNENNHFIERVKYVKTEKDYLLELQKKFEQGVIDESNLSDEERQKIRQLYIEQIEELKKSIESCKDDILNFRLELA